MPPARRTACCSSAFDPRGFVRSSAAPSGPSRGARGRDPVDTILDLVAEDRGSPSAVYFLMSEDNIRKQLARPWVSIGSDAAAIAPEGVFLRSAVHPRAYGNFARLLGKYVREERVIWLAEAMRRMTGLPATNLGPRPARLSQTRLLRGRRGVRSAGGRRSGHLRGAAPVLRRCRARVRQRHRRAAFRRAHRRHTGPRALGTGEEDDTRWEGREYQVRRTRGARIRFPRFRDSLSMHREHHRWHSWNLGWEMGVTVYGHYGSPLLFFPTSLGDEWEQDGQGMIRTLSPFIDGRADQGLLRALGRHGKGSTTSRPTRSTGAGCCAATTPTSARKSCRSSTTTATGSRRSRSWARRSARTTPPTRSFKYPDAVKRCFALSGVYDMRDSMDGMYDDNFYFNNPVDYLPNLSDPWTYVNLATCDIHIATGSGPYENSGPSYHFASLLQQQGHPALARRLGPERRPRLAVLAPPDVGVLRTAVLTSAVQGCNAGKVLVPCRVQSMVGELPALLHVLTSAPCALHPALLHYSSTTNAAACPPPDVTLARPELLRRVRYPTCRPRKRYGAKSTSMSRISTRCGFEHTAGKGSRRTEIRRCTTQASA